MRGVILAAGQGQRLRPDTDELPKTLLPVTGTETILDTIVRGLAEVDIRDIAITVGHAADRIRDHASELETRYGVQITIVDNDKPHWNNAYSLWTAREHYSTGALLVNGDTVHPTSIERSLLAAAETDPRLLLALDDHKTLTDEAMKVRVGPGGVELIHKRQPVATAAGEYIGVSLIPAGVAEDLTKALEATFTRDSTLYYEDAYQLLAEAGQIGTVSTGPVAWTEVDDHADWALAKTIAEGL
ncbi:NTP transferase domain-containing protein [Glycomyces sp. TRM65418]|uniref:phosphocholine cytidylyltransferase family protein n=1 Tax=Glycomyces sp. TRM65418 TaxID=2867006 RepID=UPI001CE539A5|nr:NTP transferase domain-containing protein [Glycomyces sp. TRM65418]MCC3762501.1 NTP transferase domain-containing protein [Glycomyces sp. TRM65418]QZD56545.1 NTP transferase domain-containing protein [Glycomyces sp. TRM65418]